MSEEKKPDKGHYFGVDHISSEETGAEPSAEAAVHHLPTAHNHHPDGDHVHHTHNIEEGKLLEEDEEEEPAIFATARGILTHVVGIAEDADHKHHEVPTGCALKLDKRQRRTILVDKTQTIIPDAELRKNWKTTEELTLHSPKHLLGRVFGEGIYLYFDFIRYSTVTNVMLSIIMLMNIIPHFYYDGWVTTDNPRDVLHNFYVSSYSQKSYPFWLWSNVAAVVATFLFGPLLSIRTKIRFRKLFHHHDHEDKFQAKHLDIIRDKNGKPKPRKGAVSHALRMTLSYSLFFMLLLLSCIIAGVINMAQITVDTGESTLLYSTLLTLFLLVSNVVWQKLCTLLTKLEAHQTWTTYRKNQTFKYFVWRVANVGMIFISRYIVRIYFGPILDFFPVFKPFANNKNWNSAVCSLNADAEQFFLLILADVTVVRLFSVLWPLFYYRLWSRCNPEKEPSPLSDRGRPDFDLADEYLDILYRQFLVYYGMSVFPWITFFGVIGNLIEYPIDKWVLINLSRTPPRLRGSMRSFLTLFMLLTALGGLVMFPQGAVWILTGLNYRGHCPCTIFEQT